MTIQLAETSPELLSKALGSVMRSYRERTGKTQERFANDSGSDKVAVWTMEHGRRNPTFSKLCEYLSCLGVGFEEFGRDMEAALEQQKAAR